MNKLIAVAGPTGSGKSVLALRIASEFQGEIVSCDSLQIYRYFDLGTAKLPPSARESIPHHLVDILDPDEIFTAGEFARRGRAALDEISARGRLPVVAGGTGFYLRALLDGLAPGPERDPGLRQRLGERERRRPGSLHRLLRRFDPRTAARIHPNDVPKVMRALEICLLTRRSASAVFADGRDPLTGYSVLKIGLFPPRDALYERLDRRAESMFANGLLEEARSILARGYSPDVKPFESLGYDQARQHLRGEISLQNAIYYTKQATRRYAKRQMTWFRQEPELECFTGFGDDEAVQARVIDSIRRSYQ